MSRGTALILVDVQQDFLAQPSLHPDAAALTAAIAELLALARESGWEIVHVRTQAEPGGSNWMPHWRRSGRAPCIAGSEGAEPPEALRAHAGEAVLAKAFYSAFDSPDLAPLLADAQVARVIVAGLHTHACVGATVLDAYARGFEVIVPVEAVASYDPDHAAAALGWLAERAARCVSLADLRGRGAGAGGGALAPWPLRNPADWDEILDEVPLAGADEVERCAAALAGEQRAWAGTALERRRDRLLRWREALAARREEWVELLVSDVGKPRADAEGEIGYGLALVDHVSANLADEEEEEGRLLRYRPLGTVALITPWNNPFAIPIAKIAPAVGYGNCALWKPALPASRLSRRLHESLAEAGLDAVVGLVTGGAETGQAALGAPQIAVVSFTGSIAVGRQIAARCGRLFRPLQAELGGNNAAIVLADADLEAAADDLAAAMFSFAGQRCTAIRRIIVEAPAFEPFSEALRTAIGRLRIGMPADPATQMGPVISMSARDRLLAQVSSARAAGARPLIESKVPAGLTDRGCWMMPTVLAGLAEESPVAADELFGPVVALSAARDLEDALVQHNRHRQGLLGAIFTRSAASEAAFLAGAEAGLLSLGRARPPFAAAGPFAGWKQSSYGIPEHGRWNRDFYTRVQAVYRS